MIQPADILRKALKSKDQCALDDLADRANVPRLTVIRASHGARGQATRADHYLGLCALLGIDPVNGETVEPFEPGDVDVQSFAVALTMKRLGSRHTVAQAAKHMGISGSVLCRMEHARLVSFECMLAACFYGGLHPSNYVSRRTRRNDPAPIAA